MTKAELTAIIAKKTGIERNDVSSTLEAFMDTVKKSLEQGEAVHLRGFGSFLVKHRKQKTGRLLAKNTTIIIPAHNIPAFKPSDAFVQKVKDSEQAGE
jgi:DNA-binding protein HU-beta